jgi:hypothetical protein
MRIIDRTVPTKNFTDLTVGEVFRSCSSIFMKISHCFSDAQIEDFIDYEGYVYSVEEISDSKTGYNAINLSTGGLTYFEDYCKVTPLDTELHVL